MRLVIYGDFNCPFSAVASARARTLEERGLAEIDWRAVEHDLTIGPRGEDVVGARRRAIDAELDVIRHLLTADEPDRLRPPARWVRTTRPTEAYAAAPESERSGLRERFFDAYWVQGLDVSDPGVIERVAGGHRDLALAARWRGEWEALERPMVPMMVLPDGYVSRGLGALTRLTQFQDVTVAGR